MAGLYVSRATIKRSMGETKSKTITFLQVPFTGLGNYSGFRGNSWLKNRIEVFKKFVIPSLQAQTSKDFVLHCCWRPEEKSNKYVKELQGYLEEIKEFKTVHTFHGILFYDDKYQDDIARQRLINNLHYTTGEIYDTIGEADFIITVLQPSDDCYSKHAVETIQYLFKTEDWQAIGFKKGYICNYKTKEVANYDPKTNPPFYSIKFTREQFTNPLAHVAHTSMKKEVGKYKVGTPLPSHEYVGDCLKYYQIDERGFIVGCHSGNISTSFDIPYKGEVVSQDVLNDFGIGNVGKLIIPFSFRRFIFDKIPYKFKRKLRFLGTEKRWIFKPFFAIIYSILRA